MQAQSRTVQTSPHTADPMARERHLLCFNQSSPQEWALLSSKSHSSSSASFPLGRGTDEGARLQLKRAKGRTHSPRVLPR